jgi:hypothetical protein
MKRQIRLTEADLHNIVKETVKRVIRESSQDAWEALEQAKMSGDKRALLDALHNLEAELEGEGRLEGGHLANGNGTWKGTPGSFGKMTDKGFERDPRFIQDF